MDFTQKAYERCFCYWTVLGDVPIYVSTSLASICTLGGFSQVILCLDTSAVELPRNLIIRTHFPFEKLIIVTPEDFFDKVSLRQYSQLKGKYSVTNKADFFRIYALYKLGGFYCDVDTMIIRSFLELPFTDSYVPSEDDEHVNNGILFAEQGHPVFKYMYENFFSRWTPNSFNEIGPLWFTELKSEFNIDPVVHHHYPIHWRDWRKLFIPSKTTVEDLLKLDVFSVHLWGTVLRRNRFNISPDFVRENPETLYSKLVSFVASKGSSFCKELL